MQGHRPELLSLLNILVSLLLETRSHYIVQAGLELVNLVSLVPQCYPHPSMDGSLFLKSISQMFVCFIITLNLGSSDISSKLSSRCVVHPGSTGRVVCLQASMRGGAQGA